MQTLPTPAERCWTSYSREEWEEALARLPDEDLPRARALLERAFPPSIRPITLDDLWIRTKDRQVVPFAPNRVQQAYLDELMPGWADGQVDFSGRRELLLKARQFGFSTLILALLFCDCVNTPNTQTVVVAHDLESTERLFQMVQRFQAKLPQDRRPETKYATKRALHWGALDSYFSVGTAGSRDYGRGGTINAVHGSEVAMWPDAEELVSGLLQTVPANGAVFLESTARGIANWFHDEYQAAKRGDSNFTPRFYGWQLHDEYRAEVPEGFEQTAEEARLVLRFGLTDEQLQWRRQKIKELRRRFPEEYPLDDHEAFLTVGGRVLDRYLPSFAPKGHLCPAFLPPREWRHYLVIDPGWRKLAGLFAAVDPDGRCWLYAEHYEGGRLPKEHLAILHAYWRAFGRPVFRVIMDPAGFNKRRTDTGHEHESWAAEFWQAQDELLVSDPSIAWFDLEKANNSDPKALRVNRYLEEDQLRICEHLVNWQWEQERWTWEEPGTGQSQQRRRDPDRPIDRFNHLMDCLVGGTLIATEAGERPIETLRNGDLVWTRDGLRPVLAAWETGERELIEVKLEDGLRIAGTPNHPLYIEGKGWVTMDCLRYNDLCLVRAKSPTLTVSLIGDGPKQSAELIAFTIAAGLRAIASGFTLRFGRRLTGLSRTVGRSTTGTATPKTTPSRTWNASQRQSTGPQMQPGGRIGLRLGPLISARWSKQLKDGMVAKQGKSGIGATGEKALRLDPFGSLFARAAGQAIRPFQREPIGFAQTTADRRREEDQRPITSSEPARGVGRHSLSTDTCSPELVPVRVVGLRALPGSRPVFNLQVADTPEFFANGILVHNCTRYLANDLPEPLARLPEPEPDTPERYVAAHLERVLKARLKADRSGGIHA